MRLLIVDEEIIAGGVETLRRQLIPALAKEMEAITWVVPAHVVEHFRGMAGGNITIEPLTSPSGIARIREGIGRRTGRTRGPRNRRLRLLARRHGSDVCMTTCLFGQEMPRLKIPVIGLVSDINPSLPRKVRDNIAHWIAHSAATFAVSDFTSAELKKMVPGYAEKIHALPLAAPDSVKPSTVTRRGCFHYSASPNAHKGHLTLLRAALGLASRGLDYRLTLSGARLDCEGEIADRIREFLAEHKALLNWRVVLAGDAPPTEVERLFAQASCVVLPSSYEGFGLPLAEALAYGKRVICSDIPPFREQIARYGCEALATFVPAGDAPALEEAMAAHLASDGHAVNVDDLMTRLNRWTWTDTARRCRELLEPFATHG